MPARTKSLSLHPAAFCAFALVICVLVSIPILNMGMDDDWSYIWCARVLANTGHVLYNGFVEPMLGWQLYLGALFIKLFGFSFTSVRASILLVAVASVALTQRLFVRLGITTWNSIIGTLTIALSPVFLVLSFSFMSDMAGYFCLILCLYACVRAVQAGSDTAALGWFAFAALSNVLGGTARQIAWLGVLVIVPSTAWFMRQRRGALLTGAVLWIVGIATIFVSMRWFNRQPYSIAGHALSSDGITLRYESSTLIRGVLGFCLILSPVLIAFLVRYPLANLRARKHAAIAAAVFLVATLYLVLRSKPVYWLAPFLDVHGGLLGEPPPPIPFTLRLAFTVLTFAVLIAFLLCLWNASNLKDISPEQNSAITWKAIATLLCPFILACATLLATRHNIYERYLLPLLFVILVPVLRLYQQKIASRLPWASALLVIFMALFGVANMHDLFAGHRARLVAANEIISSGIPRNQIRAGYEYDAWTQLESVGHLNDARIRNPAGAYHPWTPPSDVPEDCLLPFSSEVAAIIPRYRLSLSTTGCFTSSQYQPIPYTNWLPPHNRAIYIQQMR
jgi:hypothetical protein